MDADDLELPFTDDELKNIRLLTFNGSELVEYVKQRGELGVSVRTPITKIRHYSSWGGRICNIR